LGLFENSCNKHVRTKTSEQARCYPVYYILHSYYVFMRLLLLTREFKEAVLDIFNCHHVFLDSLYLHNNSGTGRLLESNRGNTGGIALGYDMLPADYITPNLTLSNSAFIDNEVGGFLNSEKAVADNVYLGRGGGVGLFMNEINYDIDINIVNCTFAGNRARLFGGGLFILTRSSVNVQHRAYITGCEFVGNRAHSGGSGVQLSFLGVGDVNDPHTFVFTDCRFTQNQSPSGGGIYIFVCKCKVKSDWLVKYFSMVFSVHEYVLSYK